MKNREELVGKKFHGFKFESGKYNGLEYDPYHLDRYIGNVGYVSKYISEKDWVQVEFGDGWTQNYPAELVEHFVFDKSFFNADPPISNIPIDVSGAPENIFVKLKPPTKTPSTDLNGYYLTPHLRYAPKHIPFSPDYSIQDLRLQQMWQGTDGSVKWIWVEEITWEQLEKEK
jgi:hypothetical protein